MSPTQKVKEPRNKTAETKSMMKNNDINKTKNRKETKGKIIEMAKKKRKKKTQRQTLIQVFRMLKIGLTTTKR